MSTLRVATYNLLHGGQGGGDRTRLDAALEVLTESNPQILMLQEARGFECDGGRLLHEVERRLGMRGCLGLAPHTAQNTAVFLAPSVELRAFATDSVRFHHAGARATVALPGLEPELTLVSVHLSPVSPAARLAEVALLADLAAPDRSGYPEAEFVPFRADRVLLSPPLADRVVGHEVIREERTDRASDHYPVVVDLDVEWEG